MTLGGKLKQLRLGKKMTLQDVAEGTGYSKALISRIENDSVSPSIASLAEISRVLDIRLDALFSAVEGGPVSLVKKNQRKSRTLMGGRLQVESLRESMPGIKMEALIRTFEAGATVDMGRSVGGSEEWWHVLKGKLKAAIDERTFDLSEGDSLYMLSANSRKWQNPAKARASALVVMTTPVL
ncbi:MAG: helix-turn-helix domain-containing protein [Candidatus Abyssobacteria bacterium SURF_17]|jgi:transcriptional regulator with XRE-family HTH domain|uniref:Helix-turn-helix domain-containing protein n=1 Tax=Candidatus Abyssobacteria bacterium SURF_17 TaxID=2093361 RepID=A0A419F956_9BACT|nr:MAG: helix-turn-helix domain-containing protein [Candidatus Abyssubacteria bacterium SURF_17]